MGRFGAIGVVVGLMLVAGACRGAADDAMSSGGSSMRQVCEAIDRLVAESYPETTAPGCAVLVRVGGETVFAKGYGVANLETGEPNTPATNFRLASMTKQFTAAAALRLIDAGKLSLDERLTAVFPDFPAYGAGITMRHLMGHTSGLPDYEDLMATGTTEQILDAGVLELLRGQTTGTFAPGTQYKYGNSAFAVLAVAVEARSGRRFADFLRDEFFVPLGMTGTVAYEKGRSEVARRAYGYRRAEGGNYEFADQSPTSAVLGDGGIYTSVVDYARWADAWFGGKVLRPETQELAWTPGRLDDGTSVTAYGCGWEVGEEGGVKRVFHTGGTTGFNTMGMLVPSRRVCVVMLANRNGDEPKTLVPRIVDMVLEATGRAE